MTKIIPSIAPVSRFASTVTAGYAIDMDKRFGKRPVDWLKQGETRL